MRRLLLVLLAASLVGLVLYRRREIDRWERRLGIGRYDAQSASAPSSRNNQTLVSIPPP
jgi:hypothetical protein